jgi:hypothetical protein
MFAYGPISAAPFVYGLFALGLVCVAVVVLSVAREERAERQSEQAEHSKSL